jgi:S-adenosylmethionine-diacylglycerol 3-amino-3-carboxypropyl transferase
LVGKKLPEELFALTSQNQREWLYIKKWNNYRWRLFTRIFLSRRVMSLLFTKKFFDQLDRSFSFGNHFRTNIYRALTKLPLQENYFLSYILLGRFYDLMHLPGYLKRENYEKIKTRLDRIEIFSGSCEAYFKSLPDNSISKFNYSNIFEWMDRESFEHLLRQTIRIARDGAVITYRNLLVSRSRPKVLAEWIHPLKELSEKLHKRDLSFIYSAYVVEKIVKTNVVSG